MWHDLQSLVKDIRLRTWCLKEFSCMKFFRQHGVHNIRFSVNVKEDSVRRWVSVSSIDVAKTSAPLGWQQLITPQNCRWVDAYNASALWREGVWEVHERPVISIPSSYPWNTTPLEGTSTLWIMVTFQQGLFKSFLRAPHCASYSLSKKKKTNKGLTINRKGNWFTLSSEMIIFQWGRVCWKIYNGLFLPSWTAKIELLRCKS